MWFLGSLKRIVVPIIAVALIAAMALPTAWPTTVTGGIATFDVAVLSATTNTVIFVYPTAQTTLPLNLKTPGPPTVYNALYTDWTAMGILIGRTTNPQYETIDTNTGAPIFVAVATGRPSPTPAGAIVPVAGPLVNDVVHYVEYVGLVSPVYYSEDSSTALTGLPANCVTSGAVRCFKNRSTPGADIVSKLRSASYSPDYFVIYTTLDASGNKYYIFYGFGYLGTLAATHQALKWIQDGTLSSQTQGWQVWSWTDTNGDGMVNPSPTDTYAFVAAG
jgi:hypothetical protein